MNDAYDLGKGAGAFMWNAHTRPWKAAFPDVGLIADRTASLLSEIFRHWIWPSGDLAGHSMGGHGRLTLADELAGTVYLGLCLPAPIGPPPASELGRKQLAAYLAMTKTTWGQT